MDDTSNATGNVRPGASPDEPEAEEREPESGLRFPHPTKTIVCYKFVAAHFGVSQTTVQRWVKNNRIPHKAIFGVNMIDMEAAWDSIPEVIHEASSER